MNRTKDLKEGRGCGSIRRIVPSEISKILYGPFTSSQQYRKDETKEKEAGNGPFYKKKDLKEEKANGTLKHLKSCALQTKQI